jgi:hypothetical protein
MTIEAEVALLTSAVQTQTSAVVSQQLTVTNAIAAIAETTIRVNALAEVENTSDADKPVSTTTAAAIALKQDVLDSTNIKTVNNVSLLGTGNVIIPRSATSLTSLDYDSRGTLRDIPVAEYLLDDSVVIESLGLFMFVPTQSEPDDDETCITAAGTTGQWILKIPAYDLLAAYSLIDDEIRDEFHDAESIRFSAYTNSI